MRYLSNIESVSSIRAKLANRNLGVPKAPGVYRWWFKEDAAKQLLAKLPECVYSNTIETRTIDNETYMALYFGISSDLLGRIKWHIKQKHTPSAVGKGFLSTLRQTISALLGKDMTTSYCDVNDFINANCYWEWETTNSHNAAEAIENAELSTQEYNYPLNISKNRSTCKEVLHKITVLRKEYKR